MQKPNTETNKDKPVKRDLFAEIKSGLDALQQEREGKVKLKRIKLKT